VLANGRNRTLYEPANVQGNAVCGLSRSEPIPKGLYARA
jgi:hypothetical protein